MKNLVTNWLMPLTLLVAPSVLVHYYDTTGLYVLLVLWIAYVAFAFSQKRYSKQLTSELNNQFKVKGSVRPVRPTQKLATIASEDENA